MKELLILDQHIHGAFGINFNTASVKDLLFVADKLFERGIIAFFPTLVTDSIENIKKQIDIIKEAAKFNKRILGIHLEGIFINPQKKGIHNSEHFLALTVENYKKIEDDFIKIVTLAPELDEGLINYLLQKGIKVQAGHCTGWDLTKVNGITHIFNAMSGINHREQSTALSALIDDNVYTEVIADSIHLNNDTLKLVFKSKPQDKVILVSDALPITHSNEKYVFFADTKIYYDGIKATSENGTIAGSTMLLDDIVKHLKELNLFKQEFISNAWDYHQLDPKDYL